MPATARGLRINVKTMIALVAACASLTFLARAIRENREAASLARIVRSGTLEQRAWAETRLRVQFEQGDAEDLGMVVPALLAALRDPDPGIRRGAAEALGALIAVDRFRPTGKARKPVAEEWHLAVTRGLIECLDDPEAVVRWNAIHALRRPLPQVAVPALIERTRDSSEDVRIAAVYQLGEIDGAPAEALDALRRVAGDEHADLKTRVTAVSSLGQAAAKSQNAVALLHELCSHPDSQIRAAAIDVFPRIGSQAVVFAVISTALSDPSSKVRAAAARNIDQRNPRSKMLLPLLLAAIRKGEDDLETLSGTMLAIVPDSPEAREAVGVLIEIVARTPCTDLAAARIAANTAYRLAPKDRVARALVLGICRFDANVATFAQLLKSVAPGSPEIREAASALGGFVSSRDNRTAIISGEFYGTDVPNTGRQVPLRAVAIQSLAALGYDARPMLPKLRDAAREADPTVRAEAESAIRMIEAAQPVADQGPSRTN
jgi:hypothetical protein